MQWWLNHNCAVYTYSTVPAQGSAGSMWKLCSMLVVADVPEVKANPKNDDEFNSVLTTDLKNNSDSLRNVFDFVMGGKSKPETAAGDTSKAETAGAV